MTNVLQLGAEPVQNLRVQVPVNTAHVDHAALVPEVLQKVLQLRLCLLVVLLGDDLGER